MQLIAPDILAEGRGLSPAVCATAGVIGLLLWHFGWRWHRFWVVVAVTVAGGLLGLHSGRTSGGHMLALGVLLAISAGVLALELARVLAFVAGGTAVWTAASSLMPAARELWVAFLVGGLAGVLLYRLWTMLLTSLAGTLLTWHAGICLAERFVKFDAVDWAGRNVYILNAVVIGVTLCGLAAQSLIERWHLARRKRRRQEAADQIRADERAKVLAELPPPPPPPPSPTFWERIAGRRKAA